MRKPAEERPAAAAGKGVGKGQPKPTDESPAEEKSGSAEEEASSTEEEAGPASGSTPEEGKKASEKAVARKKATAVRSTAERFRERQEARRAFKGAAPKGSVGTQMELHLKERAEQLPHRRLRVATRR